jgi:hypothetical protein
MVDRTVMVNRAATLGFDHKGFEIRTGLRVS